MPTPFRVPIGSYRRSLLFLVVAVVALLIAAGPSTRAHAAAVTVEPEDLQMEMLGLMNAERAAAGLPALSTTEGVREVAVHRAMDMAATGYFAHYSPSGIGAAWLLDAFGIQRDLLGENIARTMTPSSYPAGEIVRLVHEALMNSDHHRENILDGRFRQAGVGITMIEGRYYFAVVFIN